ncbi:MAG: pyruvate formate lyase family protein [Planctomycetota bacterium]
MNRRIEKLRDHVRRLNDAGVRRTTFFELIAESLEETQGEPRPIRRAKAFAHLLEEAELAVLPHSLLAGSILGTWPPAEGLPDYEGRRREARRALRDYLEKKRSSDEPPCEATQTRWALMARDHYHANVEYHELQQLIGEMQREFAGAEDLSDREIGLKLEQHFNFDYGDRTRRLFRDLPWVAANHLDLNYPRVVERGLGDILAEIRRRTAAADDKETREFYRSTEIAVEAAVRFIRRYADRLEQEAGKPETAADRALELRETAEVCRRVATDRPQTFRQALQLVWMVHIIGNIAGGSAMSFARFDQYMYPFYRRDLESGDITREAAKTLLECMWLKVNEPHMRTVQSVCLAGTTPDGGSAANELTELCLEVCREIAHPYPNTAVRVSRDSPEWLYDRIVETMKEGIGQPAVLNDDTWVPNLHRLGYPIEDAREYYNMGCVEIMIQGKVGKWGGGGAVDFPAVLELVFRNGEANSLGQRGIRTGPPDSLETFEDFMQAYLAQLRHLVGRVRESARAFMEGMRGRDYDPFASALVDDCLQKGKGIFQGGARYEPIHAVGGYGLATAADSLAAVRKFVYREERLTLEELARALEADFEGYEELQARLGREPACYGNDLDEVDDLARRLFDAYADAVHALNESDVPGRFVTSVFSYTHHVYAGELVGATPDGRKAGEAFSDTVAPSQGKDRLGPTAMLNSVTKLDQSKVTGAYALNVKLSPSLVEGEAGSAALKGLLETYLGKGGAQMQVNFVDQETLRDAQEHPEKHRDLIVRVAGYCEYFTSLDRHLQDEIISRTAHGA